MALKEVIAKLLGISAFQPPPLLQQPQLGDQRTDKAREALGGQLQPLPTTRLRWYLQDLDTAQSEADDGFVMLPAQLCRSMRRDGSFRGLLASRTKGLIRLPKRFYGDQDIISELTARNGTRSVFDEMCPPSELELLEGDGILLGIGVGELVPVPGRNYPVLVRLEPEFLQYRWAENRWYFNSVVGLLPITPGDGRWVLHIPGGRLNPWAYGLWQALGRAYINKEHAIMYRANYCAKLANPARAAYAPNGASEAQRVGFFQRILAWGVNSVFEMPAGWEVKLIESNGRGWEVFQRQIDTSDLEYMIALAGQIVTTTGGAGFSNADVPAAIRQDLIQADGAALAYTVNTQILPSYIANTWGDARIETQATIVEWDTATPRDKEQESRTLSQAADLIDKLTKALRPYDLKIDIDEVATRFGIPTKEGAVEPEDMGPANDNAPIPLLKKKDTPSPAKNAQKKTDGDDVDLEETG